MNLYLLTAQVMEPNRPSWRVLEEAGFTHEATLRERFWREGRWIDDRVYSLTAEEWFARKS